MTDSDFTLPDITDAPQEDNNTLTNALQWIFGDTSDCRAVITDMILEAFEKKVVIAAIFILRSALNRKILPDFTRKTADGKNLLHMMTIYSLNPIVEETLSHIVNRTDIEIDWDAQDSSLNTALHYALALGKTNLVEGYNRRGASLDIPNNKGIVVSLVENKWNYGVESAQPTASDNSLLATELEKIRLSSTTQTEVAPQQDEQNNTTNDVAQKILDDLKQQQGGRAKARHATVFSGRRQMDIRSEMPSDVPPEHIRNRVATRIK